MPPGSVFSARRYMLGLAVAVGARARAGGGLGGHACPRSGGLRRLGPWDASFAEWDASGGHRAIRPVAPSTRIRRPTRRDAIRIPCVRAAMRLDARPSIRVAVPASTGAGTMRRCAPRAEPDQLLAARARADAASRRCAGDTDGRRRHRRGRVHRAVDGDRADRHGPVAAGRRSSRRRRSGTARAAGTAASARRRLTHGLANGILHFPDELERLEHEGVANLQGLIEFTRANGIDCDLEETGTPLAGRPAAPGRGVPGLGRRGGRVRRDARVPRPRGGAGRGPLAALARRPVPAARARHPRRPGQAVPRHRAGRARARRPDPRAHAGDGPRASRRRRGRARPRPAPPSAPTTSSSRRRPTRAGCDGCRRRSCRSTTTSSSRSHSRRSSARRSAGGAARACPTRTTSSTTSA